MKEAIFTEIGVCDHCKQKCELFGYVNKQGLAYCVNKKCPRRYLLTVRLKVSLK